MQIDLADEEYNKKFKYATTFTYNETVKGYDEVKLKSIKVILFSHELSVE